MYTPVNNVENPVILNVKDVEKMIRAYKNLQVCGKEIVSVRKSIKKKGNVKKSLKRLK